MNRAEIWNERLIQCIEDKGYKSQEAFVRAFNKETKSHCTQTEVSRWTRVGLKSNRKYTRKVTHDDGTTETVTEIKETPIGFPSYANMVKIASFLEVSVAYLTGETDADSFNVEKASHYLKLSPQAIKKLWKITNSDRLIDKKVFMTNIEAREILNKLIESEEFTYFIWGLTRIDDAIKKTEHHDITNELRQKYSDDVLDCALEHLDDIEIPDGVKLSEEVIQAMADIRESIDDQRDKTMLRIDTMDLYRYRLQKIMEELVDDIFDDPRK